MKKLLVIASLILASICATAQEVITYDNAKTERVFLYANGCDSVFNIITTYTVMVKRTCPPPPVKVVEYEFTPRNVDSVSTLYTGFTDVVYAQPEDTIKCVYTTPTQAPIDFYEDNCDEAPSGKYEIQFLFSKSKDLKFDFPIRVESADGCGYRYFYGRVFNNRCSALKRKKILQKYKFKDAFIVARI